MRLQRRPPARRLSPRPGVPVAGREGDHPEPPGERTAVVITYDEWRGFFDRVRPPRLPDDHDAAPRGMDDHAQAGFRVTCIVLSPFARPGHIGHQQYDQSSILKMVQSQFGLAPLTRRDRAARNLAESFDFARPRPAPTLPVVVGPGRTCAHHPGPGTALKLKGGNPMGLEDPFWAELKGSALMRVWNAVR